MATVGLERLRARTRLGVKGRVVIPAAMREALGINVGDAVELELMNHEVRISTMETRLRRAQEEVRRLVPADVSLSEELSAERREAARHE